MDQTAKTKRRTAHVLVARIDRLLCSEREEAITQYGRGRSDAKHGNFEQEILGRTDCRMIGQAAAW
jgi:hypothetical protein